MAKQKKAVDPSELADAGGFDMTPMIDVTFLLIIFFMCVTELADASKANLKLPTADKAEEDKPIPGRMVINVLKDGVVQVMGQEYADPELHKLLELERQISMGPNDDFPNRAVLIRADRETAYGDVQHVMGMCMQHKLWRIAFATKNPNF